MADVYNDFFVSSHDFSLRSQQDLVIPSVNCVLKGMKSLRYLSSLMFVLI